MSRYASTKPRYFDNACSYRCASNFFSASNDFGAATALVMAWTGLAIRFFGERSHSFSILFRFSALLRHDYFPVCRLAHHRLDVAGFAPCCALVAIHLAEGETLTPMLLARRFTLNPVLVILSLAFWYWLWGVPGAILSTPILAITKIVCDRVRPLAALGHILAG